MTRWARDGEPYLVWRVEASMEDAHPDHLKESLYAAVQAAVRQWTQDVGQFQECYPYVAADVEEFIGH